MENNLTKKKKEDLQIRALLVLNGIKISDLANEAKVSVPYFSNYIRGKRGGTRKPSPKGDIIRQITANALDMSIHDIWPSQQLKKQPSVRKTFNRSRKRKQCQKMKKN